LPPHKGQGLNNCIVDVVHLADELRAVHEDTKTQPMAIEVYENEMIPRAAEEVKSSCGNAIAFHDWNKMMNSPVMKRGIQAGSKQETWF